MGSDEGNTDTWDSVESKVKDEIQNIFNIDVSAFDFHYSKKEDTEVELSYSPDPKPRYCELPISEISVSGKKDDGDNSSEDSEGKGSSRTVSLSLHRRAFPGRSSASFHRFLACHPITTGVKGVKAEKKYNLEAMLTGTLNMDSNRWIRYLEQILHVQSIDLCIPGGKEVTVSVELGSDGKPLQIFKYFSIDGFVLDFQEKGLGMGGTVEILADCFKGFHGASVTITFMMLFNRDSSIGAAITISEIDQPFNIPGLRMTDAAFSAAFLLEAEGEPESIVASAGFELLEWTVGNESLSASFDFSYDETDVSKEWYKLKAHNMILIDMIRAFTGGDPPPPFDSADLDIGFRSLMVDLEPGANVFAFEADFYINALEINAGANVTVGKGVALHGHINEAINILGLVVVSAYADTETGPFIYLDTQASANAFTSDDAPVQELLNALASEDVETLRQDEVKFAISANVQVFNTHNTTYGVCNRKTLDFIVTTSDAVNKDGGNAQFQLTEAFKISMDKSYLSVVARFACKFALELPNTNIGGFNIGSHSGTLVEFNDVLNLQVAYSKTDWKADGLDFSVGIDTDVLGLHINERLQLDVSVRDLAGIGNAIEKFIVDKVVSYFKDKLNPVNEIEHVVSCVTSELNVAGKDVIALLSTGEHDLEGLAGACVTVLKMTMDEIATGLVEIGHDLAGIADVLGTVFNAPSQAVASSMVGAGAPVEGSIAATFGDIANTMNSGIQVVGTSITNVAVDSFHAVDSFVTGTVPTLVTGTVDKVGNVATSTVDKVGNVATSTVDKAGSVATSTVDKAGNVATSTGEKAGTTAKETGEKVGDGVKGTVDKVGDTFHKLGGIL